MKGVIGVKKIPISEANYKKPEYHLQQFQRGQPVGKPEVYSIKKLASPNVKFSRRGFITTSALSTGALMMLSSCGGGGGEGNGQERIPELTFDQAVFDRERSLNISAHRHEIDKIYTNVDLNLLVTTSRNYVKIWELSSYRLLASNYINSLTTPSIAIHPYQRLLAIKHSTKKVILWDVDSNSELIELNPDGGPDGYSCGSKISLEFSSDGRHLIESYIGGPRKHVQLWNMTDYSLQRKFSITIGWKNLPEMALSNDGNYLALGSYNGDIEVWDIAEDKLIQKFTVSSSVKKLLFFQDGFTLLSLSDSLNLFNITTGAESTVDSPQILSNGEILFESRGVLWLRSNDSLAYWDYQSNQPQPVLENLKIIQVALNSQNTRILADIEDNSEEIPSFYILEIDLLQRHSTMKISTRGLGSGRKMAYGVNNEAIIASRNFRDDILVMNLATGDVITPLYDPGANDTRHKVQAYEMIDNDGVTRLYTKYCNDDLPNNATCVCNCVSGTDNEKRRSCDSGGGGSDLWICTCVPVFI